MSVKHQLLFEGGEDIKEIDIKPGMKLEIEFVPLIDIEQAEVNSLSIIEEVSGENLDAAVRAETEYEYLNYKEQSEVNLLSIKEELPDNDNSAAQTETEYESFVYIEQSEVNSLSSKEEVLGDNDNNAAQTEIEHFIPQTNKRANNVLGGSSSAAKGQIEIQPSVKDLQTNKYHGLQSVNANVKNIEDAIEVEAAELFVDINKEQELLSKTVNKPMKTYSRIKHQVIQSNKLHSQIKHQAYIEQSKVNSLSIKEENTAPQIETENNYLFDIEQSEVNSLCIKEEVLVKNEMEQCITQANKEAKTDVHINLPGSNSTDNDGNITSIAVMKPNAASNLACFSCSFTTSVLEEFIEHSYTHPGGEDPHTCEVCWSRFSQAAHLRLHLQTHTKKESGMWNHQQCITLIKLYEKDEVLWNARSTEYYNRNAKEEAWQRVATVLGTDIEDVKRKMTALLGSFRKEKSREKISLITGSGAGSVYISQWFGYKHFYFLPNRDNPYGNSDTMPESQEIPDVSSQETLSGESVAQAGPSSTTMAETVLQAGSSSAPTRILRSSSAPRPEAGTPETQNDAPQSRSSYRRGQKRRPDRSDLTFDRSHGHTKKVIRTK